MRARAVILACVGVALLLGAVARSATGQAPSFAKPKLYAAKEEPQATAVGDLNGDGKPDLVSVGGNRDSGVASVFFNNGKGRLASRRDYDTAFQPRGVAIGDLDGDGKADLAVANSGYQANSVSVFVNKGGGRFEAKVDYPIGRNPQSVAIVDLDGDGKQDLVTANEVANSVSILLGADGFVHPDEYRTGPLPGHLAIADFTGDGKPDVLTSNEGKNTVSLLANAGDGTLETKRDYRTGNSPGGLAAADVDGDGRPDVVTANELPNTASVLINRGDGSFRPKRDYPTGSGPHEITAADLNGDRKPDLVVSVPFFTSTLSVLLNQGGGRFSKRLEYRLPAFPSSLGSADFDGDGRADLAIGCCNERRGGVVLLSNAPGLCNVQRVTRMTVGAARAALARINCRVGRISRVSSSVKRGRVISQKPRFGAVLRGGGKVNLVVSKGRKR
jgi:hypothetical protein